MNDNPLFWMLYITFEILVVLIFVVSAWKVFVKAGKPGWAAIIPIYNLYVLLQIIGRPGWWIILYFIPIVNIVIQIIISLDLAKSFGRSSSFGIFMLWLLAIIGFPILAFGSSKYIGPAAQGSNSPAPQTPPPPTQLPPSPPPPAIT